MQTEQYRVHLGDAEQVLRGMRSGSVHAIVTSSPYYRLRNYLTKGQIGQEDTPDEYAARLVRVFREARRVLRDDGSLWLNLGDTYAQNRIPEGRTGEIKRKDIIGVPWLVAFALRADGWFLRSECIWQKPNATPESVADRPSRSHEHLFLLTKSARYYYDREAVREPAVSKPPTGQKAASLAARGKVAARTARGRSLPVSSANHKHGKWANVEECHGGFVAWNPRGRARRTVWTVSTRSFNAASVGVHDVDHFAVFPPDLVRPCVLASTSAAGCCPACGAPYERFIADYEDLEDAWVPTCDCPPAEPVPCTVFDPFTGSGTTGVVCIEENRRFVGSELNPDYVRLAEARLSHAAQKKGSLCTTASTLPPL
jgi:DNA modification methylase